MKSPSFRPGGAALPLVLWAIFVLATIVIVAVSLIDFDYEREGVSQRKALARQAALTGLALAFHPKIDVGSPLLHQTLPDGARLEVDILSEDARININHLLLRKGQAELRRLFQRWGVPERDAAVAADSLADWVDPDDLRSLQGAEARDIPPDSPYAKPANRPFRHVAEMEAVRGMDVVANYQPRWHEFFSVNSSGRLDIQHVPVEVLEVFGGLSSEQARTVDAFRNGGDGHPRTTDDRRLNAPTDVKLVIELTPTQLERLERHFGVGGTLKRMVSLGEAGGLKYEIAVVTQKDQQKGVGSDQAFLEWREQ